MQTEVRKRRNKSRSSSSRENGANDQRQKPSNRSPAYKCGLSEKSPDDQSEGGSKILSDFFAWINILVGLVVMVVVAQNYSLHLKLLHENQMWFSNIKV